MVLRGGRPWRQKEQSRSEGIRGRESIRVEYFLENLPFLLPEKIA